MEKPSILSYLAGVDKSDDSAVESATLKWAEDMQKYEREQRKIVRETRASMADVIEAGKVKYARMLTLKDKYMREAEARAIEESGIGVFADEHNMEVKDFRTRRMS